MNRKLIALFLILTMFGGSLAFAAGGGADDPLISLSYLKNYRSQLVQSLLPSLHQNTANGKTSSQQLLMDQVRYKQGDALRTSTGTEVVVLAGEVAVSFSSGAVINASNGTQTASGTLLTPNARYLVGEDTQAVFTVSSPTAVISCNGAASVSLSALPDYNAMAEALRTLNLLQGTGTGFGSGFDLERRPTRIEAIVMFIRLLGEEQAALSCTASHPFSDVAPWADRYVAYAYLQGYSNGAGGDRFASDREISAAEYVEFLMRALQYSSIDHTDLSTTLSDAHDVGLLNDREYDTLTSTPLLRAHVVYLSYYALSTPIADQDLTLEQKLIRSGTFTQNALNNAHAAVNTARMG